MPTRPLTARFLSPGIVVTRALIAFSLALLAVHAVAAPSRTVVLLGATVIDPAGPADGRTATIVIEQGRIRAVITGGRASIPEGAEVISLKGKFVLPGFIDTHFHVQVRLNDEGGTLLPDLDTASMRQNLRTALAFGITTIRDPGAETELAVTTRRQLREGVLTGPRLFTAGRILNSSAGRVPDFVRVATAEEVRAEVHRQARAGVDYIKVYGGLPPPLVRVAIEEAHRRGLKVIGHLQRTTWTEAAALGIDAITHGAPWSPAYLSEQDRQGYHQDLKGRIYWLEHLHLDSPSWKKMLRVLSRRKVHLDPTLIAFHTKFFGNDPQHLLNPDSQFVSPALWRRWHASSFTRDWDSSDYEEGRRLWPMVLNLTRSLYDHQIPLSVGTDAPTPWIIPGAGFHRELELLAGAGLGTTELLKMATRGGAEALGLGDSLGSIQPGKLADLVVLDADPRRAIGNTRRLFLVIQAGRIFEPESLLVRSVKRKGR